MRCKSKAEGKESEAGEEEGCGSEAAQGASRRSSHYFLALSHAACRAAVVLPVLDGIVHAAGRAFQDSSPASTRGFRRLRVVGTHELSEDCPPRRSRLGFYFLPFLPFPGSYFSFQILGCRISIGCDLPTSEIAL